MMQDLRKLVPWLAGLLTLALLATMGALPTCTGRPAPPFEGEIVAGDGVGDRVRLEQLAGRVVLLDFWASWCPPCRRSIPILNRIYARYGRDQVLLYGVNVESFGPEELRAHHRALAAAFPSLQDRTGALQQEYQVRSLPTLVLIDGEGRIRHIESGVPDEADLSERIDGLLSPSGARSAAADDPR